MESKRDFRVFTIIACSLFILVSAPCLWMALTQNYPRAVRDVIKPYHFPAAVFAFIILACLFFLVYNLHMYLKERKIREASGVTLKKFKFIPNKSAATFLGAIVYVLLWSVLGFTLSSILFMTFLAKVVEPERPLRQIAIVSVLTSVGVFLLFSNVFNVPFPEPILNSIL